MAQIVSGFRAIFSNPLVYNLAQNIVGAEKARRILVRDHFPAGSGYRMLDVGCGTAEILRHLPEQVDYVGFDASETYIAQARARFGARGIFKAELVREATLDDLQPFDIVLAFGLLHHLDDDEATALFRLTAQALKPEGKLITIDPVYTSKQNALARWIISKDRGQNIRTADQYAALARSSFHDTSIDEQHHLLNIPYSHCILECQYGNVD